MLQGKWKGVGDRRISRKLKRNVLSSCVTPTYMNALETMTLIEKQQGKVQICENNLVRIIVRVKIPNKRKGMDESGCWSEGKL